MIRRGLWNNATAAATALGLAVLAWVPVPAAIAEWTTRSDSARPQNAVTLLAQVDWSEWSSVRDLLTQIHSKTGIPAIAAAYVKDGKIVDGATVGVREFGQTVAVTASDPFHLGSVTKSITSTLIARLIEQGTLSWDTPLGSVLKHVEMDERYQTVTIENLLHHRAGLPAYTGGPPKGGKRGTDYAGTPTEIRAGFVADLLKLEPEFPPGTAFRYSNAGYAVAGYVAEYVTGASWEKLVTKHVFDPLGMSASGFGFPDYPSGHHGRGPTFTPTRLDQYPAMDFIAPAGNVHASVRDLARYAIFHLQGLNGKDGNLKSDTVKRLHAPPATGDGAAYAAGWWIRADSTYGSVHMHGGTVSSSYAEVSLYPDIEVGIVILTTVGADVAEPLVNGIRRSLLARFSEPTEDELASSGARSDRQRFVTKDRGAAGAWTARDRDHATNEEAQIVVLGEATPQEDARHWNVIKKMARALNDEDFDAYMSLFPSGKERKRLDRKSVFDFMANGVMPRRGGVQSFHALSKPIKIPDSPFPVRTAVFHLENGYPGYVGISLDASGKIDHFSLFVKPDLCPSGTDPQCARITMTVGNEDTP